MFSSHLNRIPSLDTFYGIGTGKGNMIKFKLYEHEMYLKKNLIRVEQIVYFSSRQRASCPNHTLVSLTIRSTRKWNLYMGAGR